ncbi:MAG: hypothetical protein ACK5SX_04785 [Sandaracinobacter sp.]
MSSELRSMALAALLAMAAPALAEKAPPTDPMTLTAKGEPRTCIPNRTNVSTKAAGQSVLMFRTGGGNWFRNELRARCPVLRDDRILIFRTTTTQYCELDPFDVVDPISGINFGICSLGKFTPVKVPKGTRFGN